MCSIQIKTIKRIKVCKRGITGVYKITICCEYHCMKTYMKSDVPCDITFNIYEILSDLVNVLLDIELQGIGNVLDKLEGHVALVLGLLNHIMSYTRYQL